MVLIFGPGPVTCVLRNLFSMWRILREAVGQGPKKSNVSRGYKIVITTIVVRLAVKYYNTIIYFCGSPALLPCAAAAVWLSAARADKQSNSQRRSQWLRYTLVGSCGRGVDGMVVWVSRVVGVRDRFHPTPCRVYTHSTARLEQWRGMVGVHTHTPTHAHTRTHIHTLSGGAYIGTSIPVLVYIHTYIYIYTHTRIHYTMLYILYVYVYRCIVCIYILYIYI